MKRVLGKKDCVESLTKTKMKVWLFLSKKERNFHCSKQEKGKRKKKRAKLSLFQTGKMEKKVDVLVVKWTKSKPHPQKS